MDTIGIGDKKVADLTVSELRALVEVFVWNALQASGFDPDEGLELRPEVIEDLQQQMRQYEAGTLKTYTAEEVMRDLGLD